VQKPDKEAVKQYLKQIIELIVPEGEIKKEEISNFKYNGSTKQTYYMSLSTGWIKKIKVSSTTSVTLPKKSIKNVTTYEYTVK
jgi:hypothetical protein